MLTTSPPPNIVHTLVYYQYDVLCLFQCYMYVSDNWTVTLWPTLLLLLLWTHHHSSSYSYYVLILDVLFRLAYFSSWTNGGCKLHKALQTIIMSSNKGASSKLTPWAFCRILNSLIRLMALWTWILKLAILFVARTSFRAIWDCPRLGGRGGYGELRSSQDELLFYEEPFVCHDNISWLYVI